MNFQLLYFCSIDFSNFDFEGDLSKKDRHLHNESTIKLSYRVKVLHEQQVKLQENFSH